MDWDRVVNIKNEEIDSIDDKFVIHLELGA